MCLISTVILRALCFLLQSPFNSLKKLLFAQLLRIIATILQRNPELQFPHEVRLDKIVKDAAHIMRRVSRG